MTKVSELISQKIGNAISNVQTWGGVLYNVKTPSYGAKGDGITDDTASVLSAIAAANGAPVLFPSGTYNLDSMTGIGGKVNLISFGDAIIQGFYYKELNAPAQDISATTSTSDAYFIATGITFIGTASKAGLQVKNQSQGTFIRSFNITDCIFRGNIGLITDNCIGSTIENCQFIHNQYGWKALSCTNIAVTDSKFLSPYAAGVLIDTSTDDAIHRYGGEDIRFVNCEWSDGVTAIVALKHNYLYLTSCLIDYFNMGIYLIGSKYTRVNETYIGYVDTSRAAYPLYIAPTKKGCIYAEGDQTTSRTSGIEIINSELNGYSGTSQPLVYLNGSTTSFVGVEDSTITDSKFFVNDGTCTTQYHVRINTVNDFLHFGNRYYAPLNNNLIAPWLFATILRLFSERNDYKNCFTSGSVTIAPASGVIGNEIFESGRVTLPTNGTNITNAVTFTYVNKYNGLPKVIGMVSAAPVAQDLLTVGNAAQDGAGVAIRARRNDGVIMTTGANVIVDLIIMGEGA